MSKRFVVHEDAGDGMPYIEVRPTPPVPPDAPRLLSVEELDELEKLLALASDGRWERRSFDRIVAPQRTRNAFQIVRDDGMTQSNAALIVAAVNALPRLLAAARLAATLQADDTEPPAKVKWLLQQLREHRQTHVDWLTYQETSPDWRDTTTPDEVGTPDEQRATISDYDRMIDVVEGLVARVDGLTSLWRAARTEAATLQADQEQAVVVRGGEVVERVESSVEYLGHDRWRTVYHPLPVEDEEKPK